MAYSVSGTQQEAWSLDSLGNDLAAGSYDASNEETPTVGSSGYDLAGNMTTLQNGDTATYDAWDRLAKVLSNSTIVQKNEYDGTNRRIQILSNYSGSTPGTTEDDYLSGQQVIETRENSAVKYQTIWSPRYIDAAILRDTYSSGSIVQAARVFYLSDANYNVTGLVKYDSQSETWGVAERYTYTPYGVVTYRLGNWTTTGSSANSNSILYTGRTLDLLTSLYYYRARYYDALLERFITTDPMAADVNLYRYCGNEPIASVDATGLWTKPDRDSTESWAATCAERGDTWAFLAAKLHLAPDEYQKWIQEGPGLPASPTVGKTYHIPNVLIAYTSSPRGVERGWTLLGMATIAHFFRSLVETAGENYASKNYRVEYHLSEDASSQTFIKYWRTDGIVAFAFAGHGAESDLNGMTRYLGFVQNSGNEESYVAPTEVKDWRIN